MNLQTGSYDIDYLLQAVTNCQSTWWSCISIYTYVNNQGKNLTGINMYTKKILSMNGSWSISMCNSKRCFVDNPINHYYIGDHMPGLKYNDDESLDICIQHASPDKDEESKSLPAPPDGFSLTLRMYIHIR